MRSLCALRLVSTRLDAIATPVLYRTMELNPTLVEPGADERFAKAFAHIARYTKDVLIHNGLDEAGLRRFLNVASKLETITQVSRDLDC